MTGSVLHLEGGGVRPRERGQISEGQAPSLAAGRSRRDARSLRPGSGPPCCAGRQGLAKALSGLSFLRVKSGHLGQVASESCE